MKVIIKQASYDYNILKPIVFGIMDNFCRDIIRTDSKVVIKPNLLLPASPEKAVVTHPLIIKAVVEYVVRCGAKVQISDSQAMGTFERVLKESGLRDTLKGMDVVFREFKNSVQVDIGEPFGRIEIAADALGADVLINLPKLKTHVQMLMTLGVKNTFGCIAGLMKPEWHFKTGVNRDMFANLLVRIHKAVRPAVTILDGILAMEGEGPGKSGRPRQLGVIMGSDSAFALDITVCRMIGLEPDKVFTNRAAREMGLATDEIDIQGRMPVIENYVLPEITPLVFGPKLLHAAMRRHLVQRPVCKESTCKLCGECWRYCPAKAISHDSKKIHFDYDKCIRCYCCIEVCPHAALMAEEPLAGRLIRKFRK
jgi:uncharacterized protein (DUF362 family)/Pyruvate/2-oxoacid:ferredoxin oxidoreductase delta subunit